MPPSTSQVIDSDATGGAGPAAVLSAIPRVSGSASGDAKAAWRDQDPTYAPARLAMCVRSGPTAEQSVVRPARAEVNTAPILAALGLACVREIRRELFCMAAWMSSCAELRTRIARAHNLGSLNLMVAASRQPAASGRLRPLGHSASPVRRGCVDARRFRQCCRCDAARVRATHDRCGAVRGRSRSGTRTERMG